MFSLFCKKERQWSNRPSSMFKTYEHCAPCLLGQETCITFFFNSLFNGFIKTKQQKKKKKGRSRSCESQAHRAGFLADHKLCTDWGQACRPTSVSDAAFLGRRPHPLYLMYVSPHMYIKYTCADSPAASTKPSCRKTEV